MALHQRMFGLIFVDWRMFGSRSIDWRIRGLEECNRGSHTLYARRGRRIIQNREPNLTSKSSLGLCKAKVSVGGDKPKVVRFVQLVQFQLNTVQLSWFWFGSWPSCWICTFGFVCMYIYTVGRINIATILYRPLHPID